MLVLIFTAHCVCPPFTRTSSHGELCLSQVSVPHRSSMYQHGPSLDKQPTDEGPELETQLDQFRKLGFSSAQVRAALMKVGTHKDTNRILAELIQAGVETEEIEESRVPTAHKPRGEGLAPSQSTLPSSADQVGVADDNDALRPIVIDGSNVAMSHGNKEVFSCLGIQLAVNYFLGRGHADVTVFVPSWRREQPRPDVPITDQHILRELERRKILVFTPSRRVAGKRVVCYDDRFIVKLAFDLDGIIVSNDTYRDLQAEKPEWKRFIEERLLMFSFVNDKFMLPDDPLGRHGPTLDNFLCKTPRAPKRLPCPYGKKCTYGIKCKFSHPERAKQTNRSLADELREKAKAAVVLHRGSPSGSGQVHSTSLEDVLEQKLVLDVAGPLKKAHTCENVPVPKSGLRSASRKFTPKREWKGYSSLDSTHTSSQEFLDSGLGSYECQSAEFPERGRSELSCEGEIWKPRPPPEGRHPHHPCGCCHCPRSKSSSTGCQHHTMHNPAASYCQPQYRSYGGSPSYTPVNRPHYSLPTDYPPSSIPPHSYWSEPCGLFFHSSPCPMPGEGDHWGLTMARVSPLVPERDQVRKKLLAVFNTRLVDRAMNMFPSLTDPQKLAIEILNLQSYEGVL